MFFERLFRKKEKIFPGTSLPERNKREELMHLLEKRIEEIKREAEEETGFKPPRPEYIRGEIKLNFHHPYSSGVTLNIEENDEGYVDINFSDENGKKIFGLENLLPPSWCFVSPSYLIL